MCGYADLRNGKMRMLMRIKTHMPYAVFAHSHVTFSHLLHYCVVFVDMMHVVRFIADHR